MSAKNRSLIRNYTDVKTFGSLRSAKKVIERVNSHRALSSSESRHHHRHPYRISYPIDIGNYPLCLDFSTDINNIINTTPPAPSPQHYNDESTISIPNNSNYYYDENGDSPTLKPAPLFSKSTSTTSAFQASYAAADDEVKVIEIGIARTARVMRPRLCRFQQNRRVRPPTIVDGELQVMFAAGRSAGSKRRRNDEGGISQLPLGLGIGIGIGDGGGGGSLRKRKGSPCLVGEAWL